MNQVFLVNFHFSTFKSENSDTTPKPAKNETNWFGVTMSGAISIFVYLSNTITNILPKIVPKNTGEKGSELKILRFGEKGSSVIG